jgi:transcriptional repressor NrdR
VRCPFCRFPDSRVIDSREVDDGSVIRRRRSCPECSRRFTTVEEAVLAVVKRSGVTEPFSRAKVVSGVRRACQGRPVSEDALAKLSQQVEEEIRGKGAAEVSSHEVGLAILRPLRDLDEVAYLRFASVYRSFESVEDFAEEIDRLRTGRSGEVALAHPDEPIVDLGEELGSDRPETNLSFRFDESRDRSNDTDTGSRETQPELMESVQPGNDVVPTERERHG